MKQPAFTPGPWDHDSGMYGNGKQYHSIFAPAADVVVAEFNAMPEFNPEQGRANANLIAAAPELYAALRELEYSDRGICPQCAASRGCGHRSGCILGNALAKADGKESQ